MRRRALELLDRAVDIADRLERDAELQVRRRQPRVERHGRALQGRSIAPVRSPC